MSINGFEVLRCPRCEQSRVVQTGEIVWKEGAGQSMRPLGFICLGCLRNPGEQVSTFDTEGAIKKIKAKELREKIKELEAQGG